MSAARGPACAALAWVLALGTCPIGHASAAPSERDGAYEQALHAEAAGDHALAAVGFERAYRLTAAVESGPRLLFLRASVAARLRAAASGDPRLHLCPARALLREHLGPAPDPRDDATAGERDSLTRVESQLRSAGPPDCDAPTEPPPQPTPSDPAPAPAEPRPAATPQPTATPPTAAAPPASPAPRDPRRALRIAGGASLGLGLGAFAVMAAGIVVARRADDRGRAACWERPAACEGGDGEIRDIVAAGQRGDVLMRLGATLGGLGVLAGVTLLGLGARRPRAPVALRPALGPGTAGASLSGRF